MTDDDIHALWTENLMEVLAFARAIEARARAEMRAEAAKVCEAQSSYLEHQQHLLAARACAAAIRALAHD